MKDTLLSFDVNFVKHLVTLLIRPRDNYKLPNGNFIQWLRYKRTLLFIGAAK